MNELIGTAPIDLTPAPAKLRLPQHLQLSIATRIDVALEHMQSDPQRADQRTGLAKSAAADIVEIVARYIDDREISMLSGLNSAAFHVGKIQKMIRDRRP